MSELHVIYFFVLKTVIKKDSVIIINNFFNVLDGDWVKKCASVIFLLCLIWRLQKSVNVFFIIFYGN